MFDENFSFDTSRSPSLDSSNSPSTRDTSRSVSPCSSAAPFPPPRLSVTDLAAQFADQRLRKESQVCYDSCQSYANTDDDASWQVEPLREVDFRHVSRSQTFPPRSRRSHSPSQRVQRQVNARLLCSSSHHRDIAALVARMVQSSDQCSVNPPPDTITTAALEDDEGYDSSEGLSPVNSRRSSVATSRQRSEYRRSSDMKSTGACVSKSARFRKDRGHSRIRSSEKS